MARIAKNKGDVKVAASWFHLAIDAYQNFAPHHLKTLVDLALWAKAVLPDQADFASLPAQAKMLRDRLPPSAEVSAYAGDHLDELYVDLGSLRLSAELSPSESCGFAIPLIGGDPISYHALTALLTAECHAILPHNRAYEIVGQIIRELWPDAVEAVLARWTRPNIFKWEIEPAQAFDSLPNLVFYSDGIAPAAYGSIVQNLAWLFLMGYDARQQRKEEFSQRLGGFIPEFVNLSDRRWPLPVQMRMILYGQSQVGAEMGPSGPADELTRMCVYVPDQNLREFRKMNFSADEALHLHQGGLVALLASKISIPGGGISRYIGTCPLNEINSANQPASLDNPADEARPGFVIDRQYNTWFFAPSAKHADHAWYGTNNKLFRDHFASFHSQVEIKGSLRAKHFAIPVIDINGEKELAHVISLLNESAERLKPTQHVSSDAKIWFSRTDCELSFEAISAGLSLFVWSAYR